MDTIFADITAYVTTTLHRGKAIADHFSITASQVELAPPDAKRGPLMIGAIEQLLIGLFADQDKLGELPLADATITRFSAMKADSKAGLPAQASITIDFNGTTTWRPAPDFELGLDIVDVDYYGGHWSGTIAASTTVKDISFDVAVDWPSLTIKGSCSPAAMPSPKSLATMHGLEPPRAGAATPSVDRLHVLASPRAGFVSLTAEASNLVSVGPLVLATTSLQLDYHGGPNAAFTGSLSADLTIDRFLFQVTASKTDAGWEATARAVTGTASIAEVVHSVSDHLFSTPLDLVAAGVPEEIADTAISGEVTLSAASRDRHLVLTAAVAAGAGHLDFSIDVAAGRLTIAAQLTVNSMRFDVAFQQTKTGTMLVGQFQSEKGLTIGVSELVELLQLAKGQPTPKINAAATITIKDVLLAMASTSSPPTSGKRAKPVSKYLVAADIEGGLDLSGLGSLPLIGELMPHDLSLRLSLAPILVRQSWTDDLDALNTLRGEGGPHLPSTLDKSSLGVSLQMPGQRAPIDVGLTLDRGPNGDDVAVAAPTTGQATKADGLTWKTLNKSLGPVAIQRVGFALDRTTTPADTRLRILLDASLGVAGIELSLIGLGAHYGITSKKLEFELHGMGLDIDRPPLKVAGGFAEIGGDYLGKVQLTAESISVAAMGGFKMIDGTPSMFVYGIVNTPIGGPPFFFVEGLAAGLGFNRALTTPPLDKVDTFPFVQDAIAVSKGDAVKNQDNVGAQLARLGEYVAPSLGEYFLAVGIKFTSFKMLESFVLVTLSAGTEFKIDAIGISTYQSPPIVPPDLPAMARIELDVQATVRPEQGSVVVRAALREGSYVYSPVVRLSGGFAFASWFAGPHAGDFVISAGGYHPDFKRPDHYPKVDRVGLAFKVPNFDVSIKGSAYFALTPSMLMAGGALEAHATFGSVSASFKLWIDFLVQWEPYHYDAKTGISVEAHWHSFSTTASAKLHVWGPEFAGFAEVHWTVFSFDVEFGARGGGRTPISWKHFQQSFLPHEQTPAVAGAAAIDPPVDIRPTIAVTGGQVAILDTPTGRVHVVSAHDLELVIDAVAPFATLNDVAATLPFDELACGPLGSSSEVAVADLAVGFSSGASDFTMTVRPKQFPAALWGPATVADKPSAETITSGGSIAVVPAQPSQPTGRKSVKRIEVTYDPHTDLKAAPAPADFRFASSTSTIAMALSTKRRSGARTNRAAMLAGLVSPNEERDPAALTELLHDRPSVVNEAP